MKTGSSEFENSLNDPRLILSGIPNELDEESKILKFMSARGKTK